MNLVDDQDLKTEQKRKELIERVQYESLPLRTHNDDYGLEEDEYSRTAEGRIDLGD